MTLQKKFIVDEKNCLTGF